MTNEELSRVDACRHLLDPPADSEVGHLVVELRRYMSAMEKIYNENDVCKNAVIKHFGVSHVPLDTKDNVYNPEYGDERVCKCGHSYYRHFDSHDSMKAVGCKYCPCIGFIEGRDDSKKQVIGDYEFILGLAEKLGARDAKNESIVPPSEFCEKSTEQLRQAWIKGFNSRNSLTPIHTESVCHAGCVKQTREDLIKDHISNSQNKDLCDQCLRPWNDGICSCGHGNEDRVKKIENIAYELYLKDKDLNLNAL